MVQVKVFAPPPACPGLIQPGFNVPHLQVKQGSLLEIYLFSDVRRVQVEGVDKKRLRQVNFNWQKKSHYWLLQCIHASICISMHPPCSCNCFASSIYNQTAAAMLGSCRNNLKSLSTSHSAAISLEIICGCAATVCLVWGGYCTRCTQ